METQLFQTIVHFDINKLIVMHFIKSSTPVKTEAALELKKYLTDMNFDQNQLYQSHFDVAYIF